MSSTSSSPSFVIDYSEKDAWKQHLDEQGFVVVSNIISKSDIDKAFGLFEEWMQQLLGDSSWKLGKRVADADWFRGTTGMLMDGHIQRSAFIWFCRLHPNVLELYREIHGLDSVKDLVCAMDRANAVRNTKTDATYSFDKSLWLHVDYPISREVPFPCYQSFLNLVDCTQPGSPCLRVMAQTHKGEKWERLKKFLQAKYGSSNRAFFRINFNSEELKDHFNVRKQLIEVLAPAGSLVVWKCGLVHDAKVHLNETLKNFGPLRRLNVYICCAPKSFMTKEEQAMRQAIFLAGVPSTHWPLFCVTPHSIASGEREEMGLRKYEKLPFSPKKLVEQFPLIRDLIPLNERFDEESE